MFDKENYKKALSAIGIILIIFRLLLELFMSIYWGVSDLVAIAELGVAGEIIASVVYDIAYLSAFMIPSAFALLFFKGKKRQPMRFAPRLSFDIFWLIAIGVTCTFAFSHINSVFASFLPNYGEAGPPEPQYTEDYAIILQFITIALVPAFCEEFLFRGVILSNLMPYGKSTAIVISSVLFGLMHGNFYQFLYTTASGLILGAVYVMTDSIWPSTLIHMINNALSIMQTTFFERLEDEFAYSAQFALDAVVFIFGIIGAVIIIRRLKKADRGEGEPIFAGGYQSETAPICGSNKIAARDALRSFFRPSIVVFAVYCLIEATLYLVY